jgi:ribonuclease BN (tRNA processing enzyme)
VLDGSQSLKREAIHAEFDGNGLVWNVLDDGKIAVRAAELKHTVTCFGYVVEEHTIPGKLKSDELLRRGLQPGPLYRELKLGNSVMLPSGEMLHAADVTGPPARGRKVAICGDSSDSSRMFDIAHSCDVGDVPCTCVYRVFDTNGSHPSIVVQVLVHEATLSHEMVPQVGNATRPR